MFSQKPSRSITSVIYGLLCLALLFSLAAVDGIGSSAVQASTQATSFTYLPMVTKNLTAPLDDSFGEGGKVFTDVGNYDSTKSVAIQSDGKIILAGYAGFATESQDLVLLRYNPDGSLDTTFDGNGTVIKDLGGDDYIHAMVIQIDGKIVVAGYTIILGDLYSNLMLARFNSDGSLDSSFDGDGIVVTNAGKDDVLYSLALQSDGKIVAAGRDADYDIENEDLLLARYNPDGSLDTSFGGDGIVTTSYGSYEGIFALAVQSDGNLVAAGMVADDLAVLRYLPDGSLDTSFDEDGLATVDVGSYWNIALDVVIQPDGKIVAAGLTDTWTSSDFLVARFSTDGSLDPAFDGDGVVVADLSEWDAATGVALQPDGAIVVGGYNDNDFVLLRYLSDGSLDSGFGKQGILTVDFFGYYDGGESVAIQSDGKIVLGGSARNADNSFFALIRTK